MGPVGYTHTLTRVVEVVERFIVRPLYSPTNYTDSSSGRVDVPVAALPVWERRHDTYAEAVDAGMALLAEVQRLDGFTVDKLFIRVLPTPPKAEVAA